MLAFSVRVALGVRPHGVDMTRTYSFKRAALGLVCAALAGCPMDDDEGSTTNAELTTGDASASTAEPDTTSTDASSTGGSSEGTTEAETTDGQTTGGETTEQGSSSEGTEGGTEGAVYSVSGSVTMTAILPKDGDGVGTLVVGALAECDLAGPTILGAAIVPNADLSEDGASVDFVVEPLSTGTVFLAAFLDDDGNLDPKNPLPDEGDPVLAEIAGDGILTCVEVEIDDADVTGIEIDLNEIAMPVG